MAYADWLFKVYTSVGGWSQVFWNLPDALTNIRSLRERGDCGYWGDNQPILIQNMSSIYPIKKTHDNHNGIKDVIYKNI